MTRVFCYAAGGSAPARKRHAKRRGRRENINHRISETGRWVLRRGRRSILSHADRAKAVHVMSNAAVECLSDFFSIVTAPQQAFIVRIGKEGNLNQDRWHIGPNQHHKGCFLHSSVVLRVSFTS